MVKKHLLLSCIFMTVTLCGQAQTETPQLASKPLASLSNGAGQLFLMTRIEKAKYSKRFPYKSKHKMALSYMVRLQNIQKKRLSLRVIYLDL